ncbi:recombinase family protein [Streptantibioticus rubrisoli]|uniref:Recombinase family protein n=1 Tax=Streptantibioticus rubrisoli TaxID=1387313 RepID=A0ABT1PGD1_9ACTN|nr:recombinase family protein [Streptantibioticus rubrisoli]MCQ4043365.1 recombinase family protein [Streptantibioticus rubrisoli]
MAEAAQSVPVVSYARISADTARDGHGVEDQHRVNDETAARLGWTIVHRYTDNDLSAAKASVVRPSFEAMLKALKVGQLPDGQQVRGAIVVADDRLTRRAGDYERFVDALTYDEGRVYADAKGPKNLYSEDVESMGLFGVVISKMEVRKMQRRTRRSHRRRAEQGIPVGGKRPFGWKDDKLTLAPEEAALLAEAARDLIAGRSLHSIQLEWREKGVRTVHGKEWGSRSLKLALWNPRLCGWRKHNGELVRDANGVPVQGKWEPIITPKEWMAIDALFSSRVGPNAKADGTITDYRTPSHLLTGILRCGKPKADGQICNAPLRVSTRPDLSGGYIYQCPSKSMGGCGGTARNGAKVDEYITEAVLAKLEERAAATRKEDADWGGEEELNRLVTKRQKMLQAWQQDLVSDELFFPENHKLETRIKELRAERTRHALQRQRAAIVDGDIRARWNSEKFDMAQKRALIREAMHAVIVLPVGGGGRRAFNPDLLVPKWKEDF